MSRILVIGDDPGANGGVGPLLARANHMVKVVSDGRSGLTVLQDWRPDLFFLDISVPDLGGPKACKHFRAFSKAPMIVLAVKPTESVAEECLDAGADDYVVKPFNPRELLARVRAVLRRCGPGSTRDTLTYNFGAEWALDLARRELRIDGRLITLSSTEFDVLAHLVKNAGRTVSPEELLSAVWGPQFADASGYVKLYVWYLRQKLEADPKRPQRIVTRRGRGYIFDRRRYPRGSAAPRVVEMASV